MKQKFLLVALAFIIILIIAAAFFAALQARTQGEKYCETDSDCACGVHKTTGECFYGNSNFVNAGQQCPDFCNGIAAHLEIKCMDNACSQVQIQR